MVDADILAKMLVCLERLAYLGTPTNLEFEAFKKDVLYKDEGNKKI